MFDDMHLPRENVVGGPDRGADIFEVMGLLIQYLDDDMWAKGW